MIVLGIDAAWTATQPSGVALVRRDADGKGQCLALAPSYASFLALASVKHAPSHESGTFRQTKVRGVDWRRRLIRAKWRAIRSALARHITGIALRVPASGALASLKRYEDAIDAVVCAWVGSEYLAGRAQPYGDATAAVWAAPVVKARS